MSGIATLQLISQNWLQARHNDATARQPPHAPHSRYFVIPDGTEQDVDRLLD